ncbi:MAG TPA: type I secretion C-terminal target domain-containing protein, partial [Aquabacterium sp.]|nr:type I secretion C-terminal target domain-containing protein [Aquabacterium sp.]
MPILSLSAGRVTAVWGNAYYIQPDGSRTPVHVGDQITGWQQILTDQKGIVEIEPKALSPKILKLIQAASVLDHAVAQVETESPEAAPAAGLEGGSSGSLQPGLRVDRVTELVSPLEQQTAEPQSLSERTITPYALPASVAAQQGGQGTDEGGGPKSPEVPPPVITLPPGETPIQLLPFTLSEKGLTGEGPYPTSQTLQVDLAHVSDPARFSLQPPPMQILAAGGAPLQWSSDGHGGLVGRTETDGRDYVVLQWNAASGKITATLEGPLQHPSGADVLDFSVQGVTSAADGTIQPVAELMVSVQDDSPHLAVQHEVLAAHPGTNLLIVLDTSADMAPSLNGPSRLQATLQALDTLMTGYSHAGPVAIRLVLASDAPHALGETWLSPAQAKSLLAGLLAHGGHEFDQALHVAEDAFATSAGRIEGAQNVSYFFAGGPAGEADAIDASEAHAWSQFLADHQMVSHAVGVGPDASVVDLGAVAYDGLAHQAIDPVMATTASSLHQIAVDHAVVPIKGSLLEGIDIGADGLGAVNRIDVDGKTHWANEAVDGQLTVLTTLGGTLHVDVHSGQYSYLPSAGSHDFAVDSIGFQLTDKDGDPVSSSLNVVVNRFEVVNSSYFNDTLVGHKGSDVFTRHLSDAKQPGTTTSVDRVEGFQLGDPSHTGGDVLDLRDLLQGEHAAAGSDALAHFIAIDSNASGSTLHISTTGLFDGAASVASVQNHTIILDGVDLHSGMG